EQILNSVPDLAGFPVEKVVGRIDDDQFLRLLAVCVELLHLLQRTKLVAFALNEALCLRPPSNRRPGGGGDWRSDTDHRGYAQILHGDGQSNPCAERKAPRP